MLEKMVDTVEPIRATSMSTEEIPKKLHAYLRPTKKAYEAKKCRKALAS